MPPAGGRVKGGILFRKREYPLWNPKRKAFIASEQLEELQCLPITLPIARRCRVSIAIRLASASIIRCRSAHLVEVQPNFRLTEHCSMRRAQQCRIPHAVCRRGERHSRLTIVRRGCERQRLAGTHGEAMYTAPTLRRLRSHSSLRLPMCGVEGEGPSSLSLGGVRGIFSFEKENTPLCRVPTRCGDKRKQRLRRCKSRPPCGGQGRSPFGLQTPLRGEGAKKGSLSAADFFSPPCA